MAGRRFEDVNPGPVMVTTPAAAVEGLEPRTPPVGRRPQVVPAAVSATGRPTLAATASGGYNARLRDRPARA